MIYAGDYVIQVQTQDAEPFALGTEPVRTAGLDVILCATADGKPVPMTIQRADEIDAVGFQMATHDGEPVFAGAEMQRTEHIINAFNSGASAYLFQDFRYQTNPSLPADWYRLQNEALAAMRADATIEAITVLGGWPAVKTASRYYALWNDQIYAEFAAGAMWFILPGPARQTGTARVRINGRHAWRIAGQPLQSINSGFARFAWSTTTATFLSGAAAAAMTPAFELSFAQLNAGPIDVLMDREIIRAAAPGPLYLWFAFDDGVFPWREEPTAVDWNESQYLYRPQLILMY